MKTNKIKLKIFLSCVLVASGIESYAATVKITSPTPLLGSPMIKATNTVKSNKTCLANLAAALTSSTCTNTDKEKCYSLTNAQSEIINKRIETAQEMNNTFGIGGTASMSMGAISGSLSGSYDTNDAKASKKLSMFFFYRVGYVASLQDNMISSNKADSSLDITEGNRTAFQKLIAPNSTLTLGQSLFFTNCGDSYVGTVDASFTVLSRIDVEFTDEAAKKDISGQLELKYSPQASSSTAQGSGSGSSPNAQATLKILSQDNNSSKVSRISMYFQQYGGEPAQLATILTKANGTKTSGDLLAAQKCSMATPEGQDACNQVQKAVMEYVAGDFDSQTKGIKNTDQQFYTNGKMDYSKLFYSNPLPADYPDIQEGYSLDDSTQREMEDIVSAKRALAQELLQLEVLQSDFNSAGINSDSKPLDEVNALKGAIAAEMNNMDPTQVRSPYAACFTAKPNAASCKTALKSALASMRKVMNLQVYTRYKKTLEPVIMYRITGIPMIYKVKNNKPEIRFQTCDAFKQLANTGSTSYLLNCPGYPFQAGTPTQGNLNGTVDIAGDKLIGFGASYQSCRTEADKNNQVANATIVTCEPIRLKLLDTSTVALGKPYTIDNAATTYGNADMQLLTGKSVHQIEIEPVYSKNDILEQEYQNLVNNTN